MNEEAVITYFAPAERSSRAEIERQIRLVCSIFSLRQIVDLLPDIVMILNCNRQIVFANGITLKLFESESFETVSGLRPGELIGCNHAAEMPGGCGTSLFCSTCGAVGSILSALRGEEAVQECRVIQKKSGTALDLRVWAFPLNIESQSFVLFVVHDISHEKQKRIFERMFYHDIMNTVTGLQTYTEALPYALNGDNKLNLQDIFIRMNKLSGRLADEINAQKELMTAENNELVVRPGTVNSLALLHELLESNRVLQIALGKKIVVDTGAQNIDFISDDRLLMRVIGNMVVNALEAIDSEQSVTLGCEKDGDYINFLVHNPGHIPEQVQLQIFQRSFSTKGPGRGLGTYCMRLIGERYLKGQITFISTEKDGITFKASFPLKLE